MAKGKHPPHSSSSSSCSLLPRSCCSLTCLTLFSLLSFLFFSILSFSLFYEILFPRHYTGNLIVGVILANEASYIDEWLAHHLFYGVDKILLLDDNSLSNMAEKETTRRACASFGPRCEILDFNEYDGKACLFTSSLLCSSWFMPEAVGTSYGALAPTRRQGMAMKEVYYHDNNYQKYRWVMMFDVDEFIVTKDHNTKIPDILNGLPDEVHALHVARLAFGTSNHTTRPKGPVRTSYCWYEQSIANSKGMGRSSQVSMPGLSNHFYATRGMMSFSGFSKLPKFLLAEDVIGGNVEDTEILDLPDGTTGTLKFNHFFIDPSVMVINHYITKSTEEFIARRSRSSLNYRFKLVDVYKDDKTDLAKYVNDGCSVQNLHLLPPLQNASDLLRAEKLGRSGLHSPPTSSLDLLRRRSPFANKSHTGHLRAVR